MNAKNRMLKALKQMISKHDHLKVLAHLSKVDFKEARQNI